MKKENELSNSIFSDIDPEQNNKLEKISNNDNIFFSALFDVLIKEKSQSILVPYPEMIYKKNYDLDKSLIQAIKDQDLVLVNSLLEQGANPLAKTGENISVFDYVLMKDYHFDYIKILFHSIEKSNRLSSINLKAASFCSDANIGLFLIEKGIHAQAEAALVERIDLHTSLSLTKPSDYLFLKNLFNIKSENNFPERIYIYPLFLMALYYSDYLFAYELYFHSETGILPDETNLDPNADAEYDTYELLYYLLASDQYNFNLNSSDKHRIALIISCLDQNHFNLEKAIKSQVFELGKDDNFIGKKLDNSYIRVAKKIDNILYTAMITFLNPLQKTCHENLNLDLRFKLAKTYLRSELGDVLDLIPDKKINNILIARTIDFFYYYYPEVISHTYLLIIKNISKTLPEDLNVPFQYIAPMFSKIYSKTYNSAIRQNYLTQIKFLNYMKLQEENTAVNQLYKHFIDLKIYANEIFEDTNDIIHKSLILKYDMKYFIRNKDSNSILKRLDSPFYKTLLKSVKINLYDMIPEENPDFFPLTNSEEAWFIHLLIEYCIELCDEDTLCQKLTFYTSYFSSELCFTAINNGKSQVFNLLSSHFLSNYELHCDFTYAAISHKEIGILLTLIDKFKENPDYEISSYLRDILESIFCYSLFSFIKPVVNRFILRINSEDLVRILSEGINKYRDSHYFNFEDHSKIMGELQAYLPSSKIYENDINLSNKNEIYPKILFRKIAYLQFLHFYTGKASVRIANFNSLSQINNRKLIDSLREPNYLPKEIYKQFMLEKGTDPLTNLPQILTEKEKLLYKTLINANWKLTHRVKNVEDFANILRTNEIQSVLYRKKHGSVVHQSTPTDLNSDGFIFATLGPEKSPCPNFLKNCGGFEIDIRQLLKKIPHFLRDSCVTFHLSALAINQKILTKNCQGSPWIVYHQNFQQYHEFSIQDQKFKIVHSLMDGFFTGDRIIHTLILFFIKILRAIGGLFYCDILNNAENLTILSDAFCEIMHPGIIEFRYPCAIVLDHSYTRVIAFPNKYEPPSQNDLDIYFSDPFLLEMAIKLGNIDPNQSVKLNHPINNIISALTGNLLTKAIVENRADIIDYLLEHHNIRLDANNCTLTPFEAAYHTENYAIAAKLLSSGGYQSRGIKQIPIVGSKALLKIFDHLNYSQIEEILKYTLSTKSVDILQWLTAKMKDSTENKEQIIALIKIILKTPPSSPLDLIETIKCILELNQKDLFSLPINDIKTDKIRYIIIAQFNRALCLGLLNGIEQLLEMISFSDLVSSPSGIEFLFNLTVSEHTELFKKVLKIGLLPDGVDIINNAEFHQLVSILLERAYGYNIIESLYNKFFVALLISLPKDQLPPKNFLIFFKCMEKQISFQRYLINLRDYDLLLLYLHLKNINLDIISVTRYLLNSKHQHKLFLIGELIHRMKSVITSSNTPSILLALFKESTELTLMVLKDLRELSDTHISFIIHTAISHIDNYQIYRNLCYILKFTQNLNHVLSHIINREDIIVLIPFLLFIIDNEDLASLLLMQASTPFTDFITKNIKLIIDLLNLSNYTQTKRLERFLSELSSSIHCPEISFRQESWAQRVGLKNHCANFGDISQSVWTKYNKFRTTYINFAKKSAVIFITCNINNEQHVFLGRKKNHTFKSELMAPGGFHSRSDINILATAIREAEEETKLISCKSLDIIETMYTCLKRIGRINCQQEDNSPLSSITFLHKYNKVDNLYKDEIPFDRKIYFFWFELRQYVDLVASDDFTDGTWVPTKDIKFCNNNTGSYFKESNIMTSNAMLIQLIQRKNISRTILNEQIFAEKYNHYESKKLNTLFFNSNFISIDDEINVTKRKKRIGTLDYVETSFKRTKNNG